MALTDLYHQIHGLWFSTQFWGTNIKLIAFSAFLVGYQTEKVVTLQSGLTLLTSKNYFGTARSQRSTGLKMSQKLAILGQSRSIVMTHAISIILSKPLMVQANYQADNGAGNWYHMCLHLGFGYLRLLYRRFLLPGSAYGFSVGWWRTAGVHYTNIKKTAHVYIHKI